MVIRKGGLLVSTVVSIQRNISYVKKFVGLERFNLKIKYPQFPKKLEGTIVERWAEYWQNLFRDYVEVIKDTSVSAKEQPKKTSAILISFIMGAYCLKNNPDEISYRDAIISSSTNMMFLGPLIRNPRAVEYLKDIENSYNEGTLQRTSFGLFSVIWRDDYNECLGIYKAHCEYLKVPFFKCYERIVDFGFLNRWFYLEKNMENYDVNPEEWSDIKEM